jgi:UDP-MurNAc hydroxylase
VLAPNTEHQLGDISVKIWIEESPINQDSVWVFRHGGRAIVHTVDSRLTPSQMDEVLEFVGGAPDLLLVQCSGASWYPLVYENYDQATKRARAQVKREQKLSYALSVAKRLRPKAVAAVAGPPAFLDPPLREANRDPSFPTPGEAQAWLHERECPGCVLGPLPGDKIDLSSVELIEDRAMHQRFSWQAAPRYLEQYAQQMAPQIERVYARAEALVVPDVDAAVRAHFERMLSLSHYFNERIDLTVCFDVQGEGGGCWLVDFRPSPAVRRGTPADPHQYRYRFHSRWLKRILAEDLPWEDFFLSLRFSAYRQPDLYNDHLLGLLKFNDAASLQAVEQYEKSMSSESIVVSTADGASYEIARYCPHAGASLEGARIEGHTITCLNHHYVFDLDTGECLTGNCRLRTQRIKP